MCKATIKSLLPLVGFFLGLISCNLGFGGDLTSAETQQILDIVGETPISTNTSQPPRLLTICMGREPQSLFLYTDNSLAARAVRQAIYDGPVDVVEYELVPVILENIPTLSNGGLRIESVNIEPGNIIEDASGSLVALSEGVLFLPPGCREQACAMTFTGSEPVQMDQMVAQFKLRPGVYWSDGVPLSADDSLFSYEIASDLYPRVRADMIDHTQTYRLVDEFTLEWRAVPGHQDAGYANNFFTPLPRHAWGQMAAEELLTADLSNRSPIGWGAYQIDEWTSGDHISLSRNPNYFKNAEGLPRFDRLVFRFMPDAQSAINALLAGECDYLDETVELDEQAAELLELQSAGKVQVSVAGGTGWEHVDFGILPWNNQTEEEVNPPVSFFQFKEVRQAIARCIDRERMAQELLFASSLVPDAYLPPSHPLANPDLEHYDYDPGVAMALFESAGWKDLDGDPATPRQAQGVNGVPDGTLFEFVFLTTAEPEKQQAAQILVESFAQCGIKVTVENRPWQELYAPGPDGPVFGRHFSFTQFGWLTTLQPPCFLYTSDEIPGPYPDFPKGWGGANASGYSNPEFDLACAQALSSLPGTPEQKAAHYRAQEIFAEDLPAIPLYLRLKLSVARTDMCGVQLDAHPESALWNLEGFDYGGSCDN